MRFDLLAEMERDGFSSSRKSTSRSGQINGNCIFGCGGLGNDRLRVQPNQGEYGWFICEHCNTKGTSIDYLIIKRGYTKHQALAEVGWKPRDGSEPKLLVPKSMLEVVPTHNPPSKAWQDSARAFTQYCEGVLWSELGQTALEYLRGRGLKDETIKTARLGYNPVEMRQTATKWGREKHGRLWQGIVIPWLIGADLWRVTIRDEKAVDKSERYRQVAGGSNGLYLADSLTYHRPVVLVEGEFSALSVAQECGQHVSVCATGSTSGAHSDRWLIRLAAQELVFVAFDAEESGDLASRWWLDLQNAQRLRPFWEDPNQMLQDGVDLWIDWISPRLQSIQALKEKLQSEAPERLVAQPLDFEDCELCATCLDLRKETPAHYEHEELMYCSEHYPMRDVEPATSDDLPGCTFGPIGTIQDQAAQIEAESKQKWLQGYVK